MCTDVSHDIHVTCMSVGRAVSKLVCVLIDWAELLVLLQYEFTNKDILAPHLLTRAMIPRNYHLISHLVLVCHYLSHFLDL